MSRSSKLGSAGSASSSAPDTSEGIGPSRTSNRQRRAHTRSRTGCLVCRQRHKRCDEIFVDGACERCRNSGFECVPIGESRKYTYSSLLNPSNRQRSTTSPTTHQPPLPSFKQDTGAARPFHHATGTAGTGADSDSIISTSRSTADVQTCSQPFTGLFGNMNPTSISGGGTAHTLPFNAISNTAPHPTQGFTSDASIPIYNDASEDPSSAMPLDSMGIPSGDLSEFIASLFTPMYPSRDASATSQTPLQSQYSQTVDDTLAAPPNSSTDMTVTQPLNPSDIFDDPLFFLPPSDLSLAAFAANLPSMPGASGPVDLSNLAGASSSTSTSTSTPFHQTPLEPPEAIKDDMELSSAWKLAMRSKKGNGKEREKDGGENERKEVIAHGGNEGEGPNWVDVAKRYRDYQASWYPKSPKRMKRLNKPTPPKSDSPLQATSRGAVLEALRVRADGHGVKNNLGRIYHDFALSLLGEPGSFSLSDTLAAISDLQTYNFLVAGGAASYAALKVGEAVVTATMGPRPILDLVDAVRRNDMPLVVFSQADMCHCLTTSKRKPIFAPSNKSVSGIHTQLADIIDDMPYAIPLLLHEMIHQILCSSPTSATPSQISTWETRTRELFDDPEIPLVWSRTTLFILYSRIHGVGPLHPVMREMSWEIILSLDPKPCMKNEAFPLFLSGTNALLPVMREAVRERWVRAPEKGFEEPLVFLELLWAEMDRTGRTVDWVAFLEEKKMALAFF